jgi:hypothetical protein
MLRESYAAAIICTVAEMNYSRLRFLLLAAAAHDELIIRGSTS